MDTQIDIGRAIGQIEAKAHAAEFERRERFGQIAKSLSQLDTRVSKLERERALAGYWSRRAVLVVFLCGASLVINLETDSIKGAIRASVALALKLL